MTQPLRSRPTESPSAGREATSQLVTAHQAEAAALRHGQRRQERIEQAVRGGADDVTFYHHLSDDRDASFRVYFFRDDVITVAAVELEEIDSRSPTAQESMFAEIELDREIADGGSVWLDMLSHV